MEPEENEKIVEEVEILCWKCLLNWQQQDVSA